MKIYSLKRNAIPKIAVLATGLTAAVLVATINPTPAQAYPTPPASSCAGCHALSGSVTATPSLAELAPGAAYDVTLVFTGGAGGNTGYWISGDGGDVIGSAAAGSTRTQAMTAPATAGTYVYNVWMRDGGVG